MHDIYSAFIQIYSIEGENEKCITKLKPKLRCRIQSKSVKTVIAEFIISGGGGGKGGRG